MEGYENFKKEMERIKAEASKPSDKEEKRERTVELSTAQMNEAMEIYNRIAEETNDPLMFKVVRDMYLEGSIFNNAGIDATVEDIARELYFVTQRAKQGDGKAVNQLECIRFTISEFNKGVKE